LYRTTFKELIDMDNKVRLFLVLLSSLLIFALGTYRILTKDLSAIPLFVAYIFSITGLIGIVANAVKLIRNVSN
jgi:hypothetical protein